MSTNSGKGSSTIILTQANVDTTNGLNNSLSYQFPSSINLSNSQIGVVSVSMYYCWSNISSVNGNNRFSYDWISSFPSCTLVSNVLTIPNSANTTIQISDLLASSNLLNSLSVVSKSSSNAYVVSQTLSSRSFTDTPASIFFSGAGTGSMVSYTSSSCVIQLNNINTANNPFLVGMTVESSPSFFTTVSGKNLISAMTANGSNMSLTISNWNLQGTSTGTSLANLSDTGGSITTTINGASSQVYYTVGSSPTYNWQVGMSLINSALPPNMSVASYNTGSGGAGSKMTLNNWIIPSGSITASVNGVPNNTSWTGVLTTGSPTMTGVVVGSYTPVVGMSITSGAFAAGTFITAFSGTTMTLSTNSTKTAASGVWTVVFNAPTGIVGSVNNATLTVTSLTNLLPNGTTLTFASGYTGTCSVNSKITSTTFYVSFSTTLATATTSSAPRWTGVILNNQITHSNLVGLPYVGMPIQNNLGLTITLVSYVSANVYSIAYGAISFTSASSVGVNFTGSVANNTLTYNTPNVPLYTGMVLSGSGVAATTTLAAPSGNQLAGTYPLSLSMSLSTLSVTKTYPVVMPDQSLLEVADINAFMQYTMIQNGHYLIDSTQSNVFYLELVVNPSKYAVSINTFPLPTSLPTGWSVPTYTTVSGALGWPGFPTQSYNPVMTISSGFNSIIGFAPGFQTSLNLGVGTNISYLSSQTPQIQPVPSLYLSCSHVTNIYASPSSLIYSITPLCGFGEYFISSAYDLVYNNLSGTTRSLKFQILGANNQPVKLLDPNITLVLCIKERTIL